VLLKNVGEAKFKRSLIPIAKEVVDKSLFKYITFNAYFNDVLMHEVSHGLGPGSITLPDGTKTTVNIALKELYSALEEAKADVMGVYNTLYLVKKGIFPSKLEMETMASFLAGIFRAVRFGVEEAHGKANIMEFNYLREKGAFTYDEKSKRFGVDKVKFAGAIMEIVREICMIQALGDYNAAKDFIAKYGKMPDEVKAALEKVKKVPVDILPIYQF
ncbi:MAG: peptidase, partial [Deltaproteobacteria bacterium]|nr:peptidase [Deltaproteobacteria bacterium]